MREAHTFQRISAYVIDIIIISIVIMLLTSWIPKSQKYKDAQEKESSLIDEYFDKKIKEDEFVDQFYEARYTIEKESVTDTLISIVVTLGYFVGFVYYNKGQTIGKKVMHIKVVSNDGKEVNYIQAFARSMIHNGCFTSLLALVVLFMIKSNQYVYTVGMIEILQSIILFVSVIMIICRKDKKGLHDMICKTKVIDG